MEKLIFFYEESLIYEFKIFEEDTSTDEKICILSCEGNYNILFFKVILKFIVILLKKSCFKTSFNFNKLLLRLNPLKDPLGSLLMIDHTAILSKNYDWLQKFILTFGRDYVSQNTSLVLYPNFLFSYAYCCF